VVVLVVAPLGVAAVVTAARGWTPVGELAQAELRMRGFWSDPPLVGSVARLQVDGRTTSHPGPLAFWLMAPLYALGRSAVALSTAQAVLAAAWVGAALVLAGRRGGLALQVAVGVTTLLVVRALGAEIAVQPWNPWLAVPPFLCLLVATWATLDGDDVAHPVAVLAASVVVQAHLGYLPLAVPLAAAATVAVAGRARTSSAARRWVGLGLGVGVLAWLAPVVQQLTGSPGNLGELWRAYGGPGEPAAGPATALRVAGGTLDLGGPWWIGTSVAPEQWSPGVGTAAFLGAWGAAVVVAVRRRRWVEVRLHAVLAATAALGLATTAAVRGEVHDYLVPWWPVLASVVVAATAWSLVGGARAAAAAPGAVRSPRVALAVAGAVLVTTGVVVMADLSDPPTPSGPLAATTASLSEQVAGAVRPDAVYQVRWEDPVAFGGIGYGLVLDLDRRGVRAGVLPVHRAAATDRFVVADDRADQALVVVTGPRVAVWAATPGAREVARVDPRTAADRRAWEDRRRDLRRRLAAVGGAELAARVDDNLWAARSDPRIDDRLRADLDRAARLPQPSAVFVVAPDDPPPPPSN